MDNQLEELYNKFRDELSKNDLSVYYDEADIADIFDYAGDVRDDYVRLEALLIGNRLFPDSELLLDRRAIWLSNLGNEPLRQFILDHPRQAPTPMWEILRIRSQAPYPDDMAIEQLENFIGRFRLGDDETIIQFVALARHLQQEQWLIHNLDHIRSCCEYPPTLLFEIARMAETEPQSASAIPLLEELTELDPFNTDYWGLMAELQSNCERYDDSLASLEYAKALEPNDVELLTIEGYNYLKLNRIDEAIETLQQALAVDADYFVAKRNLLEAYKQKDAPDKCAGIVRQLFAAEPSDSQIMLEMLMAFPDEHASTLGQYYSVNDPDENDVILHAGELCRHGRETLALNYLSWYQTNFGLTMQGKMVFIELLYHNGLFNEAYQYLIDNLKSPTLTPADLPFVAVIASLLMKLHIFDEALNFCKSWTEKINDVSLLPNSFTLVNRGLRDMLRDISALLESTPEPNQQQIDAVTL